MASVKILGIETSSPVFSVAVWREGQIASSLKVGGMGRPCALLSDLIKETLLHAGTTLAELDGFAISIGPGSFTGLRVGVTTVKTVAFAMKKPVLPVSSLEVIAQNVGASRQAIVPFVDARKGKVYTALFSPDGAGRLKRMRQDELLPPQEALASPGQEMILIGDGIRRFFDLAKGAGERFILAPEWSWVPSAEHLCRIAAAEWPKGQVDDPHRLVPQYLYSKESDITGW